MTAPTGTLLIEHRQQTKFNSTHKLVARKLTVLSDILPANNWNFVDCSAHPEIVRAANSLNVRLGDGERIEIQSNVRIALSWNTDIKMNQKDLNDEPTELDRWDFFFVPPASGPV